MPAGPAEIFGDTGQHWISLDLTNALQAQLCVNLITVGSNVGEILNGQYSLDQGATWTTLGGGIIIDSTVAPGLFCEAYTSLPTNAKVVGVFWRMIGTNGAGLGDNPAFTIGYEQVQYRQTIGTVYATAFTAAPTATQATVQIRIGALIALSETVNYQVYICSDGSSTC